MANLYFNEACRLGDKKSCFDKGPKRGLNNFVNWSLFP